MSLPVRGHTPVVGEFVRESPDAPLKIIVNERGETQDPDGRFLSKKKYKKLYDAIGEKFGGTDTEFRLPDLRARVGMSAGFCQCGMKIEVMAYRGTGVCSLKCKKKYLGDVSSVGTIMFVTNGEKAAIEESRNAQP